MSLAGHMTASRKVRGKSTGSPPFTTIIEPTISVVGRDSCILCHHVTRSDFYELFSFQTIKVLATSNKAISQ